MKSNIDFNECMNEFLPAQTKNFFGVAYANVQAAKKSLMANVDHEVERIENDEEHDPSVICDLIALIDEIINFGTFLKISKEQLLRTCYKDRIDTLSKVSGKESATVSCEDNGYTVTRKTYKKVTWNQGVLRSVMDTIEGMNVDFSKYIEVKYNMSESAYKSFQQDLPMALTELLDDARNVSFSGEKFSIKPPKRLVTKPHIIIDKT